MNLEIWLKDASQLDHISTHMGWYMVDRKISSGMLEIWAIFRPIMRVLLRCIVDRMVTLYGPNSVLGRSIVVHKQIDDLGKGGN